MFVVLYFARSGDPGMEPREEISIGAQSEEMANRLELEDQNRASEKRIEIDANKILNDLSRQDQICEQSLEKILNGIDYFAEDEDLEKINNPKMLMNRVELIYQYIFQAKVSDFYFNRLKNLLDLNKNFDVEIYEKFFNKLFGVCRNKGLFSFLVTVDQLAFKKNSKWTSDQQKVLFKIHLRGMKSVIEKRWDEETLNTFTEYLTDLITRSSHLYDFNIEKLDLEKIKEDFYTFYNLRNDVLESKKTKKSEKREGYQKYFNELLKIKFDLEQLIDRLEVKL